MPKIINNGTVYSGVPAGAGNLFYDNSNSSLEAANVQDAIDEMSGSLTTDNGTPFKFGYNEETGEYGYIVTDSEGADTFCPFSNAKKLYEALQHSGLVTEDMTFDEMCAVLAEKFSKTSITYVCDGNSYTEDVKRGSSCLSPTTFTPSKSNCEFLGWSLSETATVETILLADSEPLILYAVFADTSYQSKQYYYNDWGYSTQSYSVSNDKGFYQAYNRVSSNSQDPNDGTHNNVTVTASLTGVSSVSATGDPSATATTAVLTNAYDTTTITATGTGKANDNNSGYARFSCTLYYKRFFVG